MPSADRRLIDAIRESAREPEEALRAVNIALLDGANPLRDDSNYKNAFHHAAIAGRDLPNGNLSVMNALIEHAMAQHDAVAVNLALTAKSNPNNATVLDLIEARHAEVRAAVEEAIGLTRAERDEAKHKLLAQAPTEQAEAAQTGTTIGNDGASVDTDWSRKILQRQLHEGKGGGRGGLN